MLRKAFLCHSSSDKDYVRLVANRLGRARVVFDEMSFQPGQDFRSAIRDGLASTALFVFFVSRESISSTWCRFELDEAERLKIADKLADHLTIIIDRRTTFSDLPVWLQRSRALIQPRPSQATRDIQNSLYSLSPAGAVRPFVGRQDLHDQFAQGLLEPGAPRRLLLLSGLDGIGRRSYLERVCRDNLGLSVGPYFVVDETRSLDDVFLWLVDETSESNSRETLAEDLRIFKGLDSESQVCEVLNRLRTVCHDRTIPCLIDQGGLLGEGGQYRPSYRTLLENFAMDEADQYLAILHRRRPLISALDVHDQTIFQRVPPLKDHEIQLLLQQILRDHKAGADALRALVPHLAGYAPAAYMAASYVQDYGFDALLADVSALVDFKAKRFTRFLSGLLLTDSEWTLLSYLAGESGVALTALAAVLEQDRAELALTLRRLIDQSLVVAVDDNYFLSPPIRDAVFRIRGPLPAMFYQRVAQVLTREYWTDKQDAPTVEIVDATLNATARSGVGSFQPYDDLLRASTIHRLAQESYRQREWEKALEFGSRARLVDPSRRELREIVFKALVQLERWREAERVLREIEAAGDKRRFYLQGFLLRRRRRYAAALDALDSALAIGDRSVSVYRDRADCLYRVGNYQVAIESIKQALVRDSENPFSLDLQVRIYLDNNDIESAERALAALERYDVHGRFIHHRKATVLAKKRAFEVALVEAQAACDSGFSPFEAYASRIDILIELERYNEAADGLDQLDQRFGRLRADVQRGLRCKMLLRQGKWREAKQVWDSLDEKSAAVHLGLLRKILLAKAQDGAVSLAERAEAKRSADEIHISEASYVSHDELEEIEID